MNAQSKQTKPGKEPDGGGSLRWVRTSVFLLVLIFLLLVACVVLGWNAATDAVHLKYCVVAACLFLGGLFSVLNSQTIGSRRVRSRVLAIQQVLLGSAMTLGQIIGWSLLYLLAREVLLAATLSSGLFLIGSFVTVGFAVLIGLYVWYLGTLCLEKLGDTVRCDTEGAYDANLPHASGSRLIGLRFWGWLTVVVVFIFFLFGLFPSLAPYPLLDVSKGVYLTTLYVVLFCGAVGHCVVVLSRRNVRQQSADTAAQS